MTASWLLAGCSPAAACAASRMPVQLSRPDETLLILQYSLFAKQHAMLQQFVPSAGSHSCACEVWHFRRLRARLTKLMSRWCSPWCGCGVGYFKVVVVWLGQLFCKGRAAARGGLFMERGAVWDRARGAPAGSLHRTGALSNWADIVEGLVQNWAQSLHGKLCDLGYHLPTVDSQHMPRMIVSIRCWLCRPPMSS